MKKIAVFLMFLTVIACCFSVSSKAAAEDIDLSGLSFQELVELQSRIQKAIWESGQGQEVRVPAGIYQVGVDIPAGKWTIAALPNEYTVNIRIGAELSENKMSVAWPGSLTNHLYGTENWPYDDFKMDSWAVTLTDGLFVELDGAVVFTPYTGPDFSFE